jgi:hypothetical protein
MNWGIITINEFDCRRSKKGGIIPCFISDKSIGVETGYGVTVGAQQTFQVEYTSVFICIVVYVRIVRVCVFYVFRYKYCFLLFYDVSRIHVLTSENYAIRCDLTNRPRLGEL